MASIRPHKSGGYRVQINIKGNRDSQVFRTKREAEGWAAARETELRSTARKPLGERYTLSDAMRRYRDEVSPTKRGERWERVRIKALLNDDRLPLLTPIITADTPHFADWRDARLREVAASTVLREFSLLSAILETARREWRWIERNPIRDVRKPRAPASRDVVISRQQIRGMLVAMNYSPRGEIKEIRQKVAVCFLIALRTGMREGEITGLTWDLIHEGFCRLPETKTVPRDVPLTQKATRLFLKMGKKETGPIFNLTGKRLDSMFRKYRKVAGLKGFTFHDARHTAATWISGRMRSAGIPAQQAVFDLCKMFGWARVDQALTYYNPSAADIAKRIS